MVSHTQLIATRALPVVVVLSVFASAFWLLSNDYDSTTTLTAQQLVTRSPSASSSPATSLTASSSSVTSTTTTSTNHDGNGGVDTSSGSAFDEEGDLQSQLLERALDELLTPIEADMPQQQNDSASQQVS